MLEKKKIVEAVLPVYWKFKSWANDFVEVRLGVQYNKNNQKELVEMLQRAKIFRYFAGELLQWAERW